MFINLSNHALQNWSLKQKEEAEKYGELIDLPFPNISPYADSVEIDRLVEKYFNKVYGKGEKYENASEWQTDFVGRIWIFSIDNGKEYRLTLSYYHWRDDEKETAPYHLTIHISRNFKA